MSLYLKLCENKLIYYYYLLLSMSNREELRRLELSHPESVFSESEREERRYRAQLFFMVGNIICMSLMMLMAVIVVGISVRMDNANDKAFVIFCGIILDIIICMVIAYRLGNRFAKNIE